MSTDTEFYKEALERLCHRLPVVAEEPSDHSHVMIFGGDQNQANCYKQARRMKLARVAWSANNLRGFRGEVHLVGSYGRNQHYREFRDVLDVLLQLGSIKRVVVAEDWEWL